MEGTGESNAIFQSLNLDPQLFVNEVLNCVDDLLDEALLFFHQQSSKLLKIDGTDRNLELSKGVAHMGNNIHLVMDNHLEMWEKYCLRHCFKVPEGLSLPKNNDFPGDALVSQDAILELELDTQLDSLRRQLYEAKKESDKLNQELQALERESISSDGIVQIVNDVLQMCEQTSAKDTFQEMMTVADELRSKIKNLKAQAMEEKETRRIKKLKEDYPIKDLSITDCGTGLGSVKLENLQKLLSNLKK